MRAGFIGVVACVVACVVAGCGGGAPVELDGGGVEAGLPSSPDAGAGARAIIVLLPSQRSLEVTDRGGERASATLALVRGRAPDDRVAVLQYGQDSVERLLELRPVSALSDVDRLTLSAKALLLRGTDQQASVRAALETARALIAADVNGNTRYDVVLVADGVSTTQETEVMCGSSVPNLLAAAPGRVRLSAVHLMTVDLPRCESMLEVRACSVVDQVQSACPRSGIDASAVRLRTLAARGGGTFSGFYRPGSVEFRVP